MSEEECIPIGDFSFDPHKLTCCSLESGNVLAHGAGGKGYGLATTAITSGCFIWKVRPTLAHPVESSHCCRVISAAVSHSHPSRAHLWA